MVGTFLRKYVDLQFACFDRIPRITRSRLVLNGNVNEPETLLHLFRFQKPEITCLSPELVKALFQEQRGSLEFWVSGCNTVNIIT